MTQSRIASAALIALALTACNRNPTDNIAIDNGAASPTANGALPADPTTQAAQRTTDAGNPTAAATTTPPLAAAPKPGTAIPAAFLGRWGMVPADCTSTRGDAKGLITVAAAKIRFYESTATLKSVATDDPAHFVGNFDFAGEGQTWKRSEDLKLTGGNQMLVRTDDEGSAKYRRCR